LYDEINLVNKDKKRQGEKRSTHVYFSFSDRRKLVLLGKCPSFVIILQVINTTRSISINFGLLYFLRLFLKIEDPKIHVPTPAIMCHHM